MAQIDASIPLSFRPTVDAIDPTVAASRMMSLADLQQRMQAGQQQMGRDAQMRNIFADKSSYDEKGNLKLDAIHSIMGVDPKIGMAVDKSQLDRQAATADLNIRGQQLIEDKVRAPSSIAYRQAKERGMNDVEAKAVAQTVYSSSLKDIQGSGLFSDREIQQMPTDFDFARVSSRSNQYLAWQEQQRKGKLEDDKFGESKRHNKAEEGIQGANVSISRGNLDLRKQELDFSRGQAVLPSYDKPVEVQYKGQDGTMKQAMAQQDANPKSKTYGQWVTADEKHEVIKGDGMRQIKSDTPLPGDESVEGTAKAISEYRNAPLSNLAMSRPQGAAIMARVRELNPEYDATQYAQRVKAARDFGTGKQGDTARSLNVAVSHLDTLDELAGALKNGDTKILNEVKNRLGGQFGQVAPGNFNFAKQLVADEVIKAVLGSGAGGSEERKRLEDNFANAKSWDQLRGVIATAEELMGGQLGGIRQQYTRTTGRKDFDEQFLSERTSDVLSRHEPKRARGGEPAVGGAVPRSAEAGGPTQVKTAEDYAAIKPGAQYLDPDGNLRTKGGK